MHFTSVEMAGGYWEWIIKLMPGKKETPGGLGQTLIKTVNLVHKG